SGQLELAPEWLPLDSLLPPVIRVFEEMARQKQLSLYFQSDIEPDAEILVDAGRLRQVIANYLSNAVKFTVAGQIDVRINSQRSTTDFLLLHIAVEDSGPGISQADREKLFKPFIQLEAGRRQTGTGLGLVIGSQLLEKMGG
ncbi:sensor histidine kinase, partial [Cronobacter sakazakii]